MLLHECYLPDDMEQFARARGHSCVAQVGRVAAKAGVGSLVLLHLMPFPDIWPVDFEVCKSYFPSSTIGHDGMELNSDSAANWSIMKSVGGPIRRVRFALLIRRRNSALCYAAARPA